MTKPSREQILLVRLDQNKAHVSSKWSNFYRIRPIRPLQSQMKLLQRLVSGIVICCFFSIFWLLTISSTDYTLCKLEGFNSSVVSIRISYDERPQQNEEDSITSSTNTTSPTTTTTTTTTILSAIEYQLIEAAIAKVKRSPFSQLPPIRRLDFRPKRYYASDVMNSSWVSFKTQINNRELYSESSESRISELLENLVSLPITRMRQKDGGTQLKLAFTLSDGTKAIFKPMRFKREVETLPDHFYFTDFERHNAEIAAFHLDRIMGFHRVPPIAGRYINITRDLERLADREFKKTIFVSPAGNICFHGRCSTYCDTGHAFCGNPDIIEGAMATYLPHIDYEADRDTMDHPWQRSYHKRRKAPWEKDPDYCKNETNVGVTRQGRRLNDIIDMAVFDFLIGNLDRHHFEVFTDFGDDGYPIILDNGRGFGRSGHDEISILAPLYQCCRIRYSTLKTLLRLTRPSSLLSELMQRSLLKDSLPNVLLEPHLKALDRRVLIILRTVHKCLAEGEFKDIIVDDGY